MKHQFPLFLALFLQAPAAATEKAAGTTPIFKAEKCLEGKNTSPAYFWEEYKKNPAKILEHGHALKAEGDSTSDLKIKRRCYEMALAMYEIHTKQVPGSALGHRASGDLYFHVRDLEAAKRSYKQVLSVAAKDAEADRRMAEIEQLQRPVTLDCKGTLKAANGEIAEKNFKLTLHGEKAEVPGTSAKQAIVTYEKFLVIQGSGTNASFKFLIPRPAVIERAKSVSILVEETAGSVSYKGSLGCSLQ